ncbi:unnamed protein product [Rotaria sp. Silwood2]|nr:unnamed protein product [Rotaria sp. Silwood2]
MTVNYLNEIISIFLQRNIKEIGDNELSIAMRNDGKPCSIEEIRRIIQSFGSSLFRCRYSQEDVLLVQIEPLIKICKNFLSGKCNFKTTECNQLHLCHRFDHNNPNGYHVSRDFTCEHNRRIIEQSNCQNINPILLVQFIQLNEKFSHDLSQVSITSPVVSKTRDIKSSSVQSKPIQQACSPRKRIHSEEESKYDYAKNACSRDNVTPAMCVSTGFDTNYSLDISFLSRSLSRHIKLQKIEEFLKQQGLNIHRMFESKVNGYFNQYTIQYHENNNNLLTKPNITYQGIHMKFKRTNPLIDQQSFALKLPIDFKRNPLIREEVKHYINTLTNSYSYKITEVLTQGEQILLIQCNNTIDFDMVRRLHKSRSQLQGTNISLKQVYELENVIITSVQNSLLSIEIIERILQPVFDNIFNFTIQSNQTARVEFVRADHLKEWLFDCHTVQRQFGVKIQLDVRCVDHDDDDDDAISGTSNDQISTHFNKEHQTSQVTVYIRRIWAMIVNHPIFGIEYKNYIRTELGVEIDIHDNRIQAYFYSNLDQAVRENPTVLLTDTTYTFMENFDIRSIVLQKITEQLKILHAHSNAVAFYQAKDNFYMLTAKKSYMEVIMHELSSIVSIDDTLKSILSSVAFTDHETIKTIDGQQVSTCVIPSSLYNSTTTDDQYIVTDDIISKSVTLSFKTPTHTALFTRTTFQSNLQIYFHTKYSVKLYFEPTVNINSSTLIKIIGRQSTIDLAIQELETLVSLCRTKTFNETTDHDWTKINDAIHVIQYHLDTMNIKCVCQQQIAPASIMVHYIDKTHIEFGVDEQIIEKLCRETLISVICTSTIVEKEWAALKSRILQRDNYGKDISLLDEQQTISLFGLPEIVKQVQQLFEDKKATTNSSMRKNQLRKARTEPIRKLQGEKSEHWSPSNNDTLNQESNQSKQKTIETYSITFDIDEPGFEVLVNKSFNRLLAIIESKCQLEKEIIHHPIQIEIPKSKVNHSDDSTSHNKSQEDNPKSMDDASKAFVNLNPNMFQISF